MTRPQVPTAPGRRDEPRPAAGATAVPAPDASGRRVGRVRRWYGLPPLVPAEPPAGLGTRLSLTIGTLLAHLLVAVAAVADWDAGVAAGATAVFVVGFGAAPALTSRSAPGVMLVVTAVAVSLSVSILVGLAMAWTGTWAPTTAFAVAAGLMVVWLLVHLVRDVRRLRRGGRAPVLRPDRTQVVSAVLAVAGLAATTGDALAHRTTPPPGGLLTVVGPVWYVGLVAVLTGALLASLAGRSPALPILALPLPVVAGQAIVYGVPTVMAAARHVGVVEYVRADLPLIPDRDIYQAWSGLFAGAAWLSDVARVGDPLTTVANWWAVVLTVATTLAVRAVAGNLALSPRRAWWAAGVFVLANSLNVTFFSPQSLGIFLALAVLALVLRLSTLSRRGRAGYALQILVLACALAVSHQISPYLLVLALGVLTVSRLVQQWWPVLAVLVPAVAWALVNLDQVLAYVSPSAVGNLLDNVRPPSLSYNSYEQALTTRLTFGLPALLLVVVGLVAVLSWWQHRDRRAWVLMVLAASPVSMGVASDYGQETIFRVVLFALPWLCIGAALVRLPAAPGRIALVGGAFVLVAVNAYGLTGMDWARVMRIDEARQLQAVERSAEPGSVVYLLGTGAASPTRTTADYVNLDWGVADYYSPDAVLVPAPASEATAGALLARLSADLRGQCAADCYLVVSDSAAAYSDRYGIQHLADHQLYARVLAGSPDWETETSGPTATVYRLVRSSAAGAGG